MAKLVVAIDNGLSGSKVIYLDPEGRVQTLFMRPEMAYLASTSLLNDELPQGRPESDAWLTVSIPGGTKRQTVALGSKATSLRGQPPFNENKYLPAVYKTLAILGCLAERLGLTKLEVSLATVLPYTEFKGDKDEFTHLLEKTASSFEFRGEEIRVAFDDLLVAPEASGIALNYIAHTPNWSEQNILVLMVGHRDVSVLTFQQGRSEAYGSQLGFHAFLKDTQDACGLNLGNNKQSMIAYYLYLSHKDMAQYARLIAQMVVKQQGVEAKATQIEEAIAQNRQRYAADLEQWLTSECGLFLHQVDQVIVSGGAGKFFQPELYDLLSEYCASEQIAWGMATTEMADLLGIATDDDLFFRLGDLYGVFRKLVAKLDLADPLPTHAPVDQGDIAAADLEAAADSYLDEDLDEAVELIEERIVELPPVPKTRAKATATPTNNKTPVRSRRGSK